MARKRCSIVEGQRSLFNTEYRGRFYRGQLFSYEHRRKIAIANAKAYEFRGPNGQQYQGKNIEAFAIEHQLSPAMMRLVASGNCYSHRGWTLPKGGSDPRLKSFRLISPEGELVEGQGIRAFAIALGLSPGHLANVIQGIRPQCQGWRLATPENLHSQNQLTPLQTLQPETLPSSERFSIDKINQIRLLRAQGFSYSQICQTSGVCHSSAVKYGKNIVKGQIEPAG